MTPQQQRQQKTMQDMRAVVREDLRLAMLLHTTRVCSPLVVEQTNACPDGEPYCHGARCHMFSECGYQGRN